MTISHREGNVRRLPLYKTFDHEVLELDKMVFQFIVLACFVKGVVTRPTDQCPAYKCPAGNFVYCDPKTGTPVCRPCANNTFQPDENRNGDQCRLKKLCTYEGTHYISHGTPVSDAQCACDNDNHMIDGTCFPNPVCIVGLGQDGQGGCEKCSIQGKYSDTADRVQECQTFQNCALQGKCTIKEGSDVSNRICGSYTVDDVSKCPIPGVTTTTIRSTFKSTSEVTTEEIMTTLGHETTSSTSTLVDGTTASLSDGWIAFIIISIILVIIAIVLLILYRLGKISCFKKHPKDGPHDGGENQDVNQALIETEEESQLVANVKDLCANNSQLNEKGIEIAANQLEQNLANEFIQPFAEELLTNSGYKGFPRVKVQNIISECTGVTSTDKVVDVLRTWKQITIKKDCKTTQILDALKECNIAELNKLRIVICKEIHATWTAKETNPEGEMELDTLAPTRERSASDSQISVNSVMHHTRSESHVNHVDPLMTTQSAASMNSSTKPDPSLSIPSTSNSEDEIQRLNRLNNPDSQVCSSSPLIESVI